MFKTARVLLGLAFFSVFSFWLAGLSFAGPGSVEVQTAGDITIRMGAQVRIIPTAEIHRDFGLSNDVSESDAAKIMPTVGGIPHVNTRAHLTEAGGDIKDHYIRNEDRIFLNFAHKEDWDVYMALEYDGLLDSIGAERTDWALGEQTQQFGIERLLASFNLPIIYSRLEAGWDERGVDVEYGGMVYGDDDDPGLGIVGAKDSFKWSVWYVKLRENEAGYMIGTRNPVGPADGGQDSDRTLMYGKVGYDLGVADIEGFYVYDYTGGHIDDITGLPTEYDRIKHEFIGLQGNGELGILKAQLEAAYSFGTYAERNGKDYDIGSWAFFGDVAADLHDVAAIKSLEDMVGVRLTKLEAHIGAIWAQGDNDWGDHDLAGWTPVTACSRFTPAFGTEQGISFDGNPMFGQILYSIFPTHYGSHNGGGLFSESSFDNPGLIMIGGGIKAGLDKWSYKGNLMAMWFQSDEAVANYYKMMGVTGNINIDNFMGIEWNNEVTYKLYKNVAVKGGAAFLLPGSGAKDITRALEAYAAGVDYKKADASKDVSMRFAAELLWYF